MSAEVGQGVLEVVREVLLELGAKDAAERATLDSSLDKDLGLGSLERVELLIRLEQRFDKRLPDDIAQQAETPGDYAAALIGSDSAGPARIRYAIPKSPPAPEPFAAARTFVEVLRRLAESHPERVQVHLLEEDVPRSISYGRLYKRSQEVAAGLITRGLEPGETVAIMLPTCAEFFYTFFGVALAGGIAVPIYPPARPKQIEEYVQRQLAILRNAEVKFLISFDQAKVVADVMRLGLPSLIDVVTAEELAGRGRSFSGPWPETSEIFFIQYTSGSTGNPKGVTLTHSNVLANVRGIGEAVQATPHDVVVSWLPLYHDMGLIGSWLFSVYHAHPITVMSPLDFLSRPERWLWAMSDSGGTLCPAPNFSFDLCTAKVSDAALEDVDLSPWRIAINAGEPVLAHTLEAFAERFAPVGFHAEAYVPCYGLAESSVALTFPAINRSPVIDVIDRIGFERDGIAAPATPETQRKLRFVANGQALRLHEIKVVDDAGNLVTERVRGRILFRGPSRTAGYYRNPEASSAVIDEQGWMDSGDLGYQADGELYVTGRIKDVIIKSGHNIIPQDVEVAAAEVEGVRKGCVAAFGSVDERAGTERLIVVAETRVTGEAERSRIKHDITENVAAKVGMPPDVVQLAPPHAVPKTSSGKIRRNETRQLYESGQVANRRTVAPWLQLLRLWLGNLTGWINHIDDQVFDAIHAAGKSAGRWSIAAPFGLAARLTPSPRSARFFALPALRMLLSLEDVEAKSAPVSATPGIYFGNRLDRFDAAVLLTSIPSPAALADQSALGELPGPMAFLIEPLITPPTRNAADLKGRIQSALQNGLSVIVLADSPAGESAARSRFRLEALEAAALTATPVIPIWRNAAGLTLGAAQVVAVGDSHALQQDRDQLRSALSSLAQMPVDIS
ncbi:MAG: AMP-binding protein [Acidobacteria bacterium]|nr:AMP-binding protein [Acidobacteriota bacterium]MDA1234803.1 AMP-binding protein [Acidobacteriota bacterium]